MQHRHPLFTFGFGVLLPASAVMLSLYGAGIYGKTLKYFRSEMWFFGVFLALMIVLATLAAKELFPRPYRSHRLLELIAAATCLYCGRYISAGQLGINWLAVSAAFGVPTVMIVLVRRRAGLFGTQERTGTAAIESSVGRFSLKEMMAVTALLAFAITHGLLARYPQEEATALVHAIDTRIGATSSPKFLLGDLATTTESRIEPPKVASIELYIQGGETSPLTVSYSLIAAQPNSGQRDNVDALIQDLRAGWLALITTSPANEMQHVDTIRRREFDDAKPELSLYYRTGDREGVIEVSPASSDETSIFGAAIIRIQEQARTSWLTITPSFFEPLFAPPE